ncbi:MAG: hypothetical protein AAF346_00075 [Pseudomonadota bacterium]
MDKSKLDLDKLLSVTGMQAACDNALQNAAVHGTGYVMLSSDETGIQAVEVDPQQVTFKTATDIDYLAALATGRILSSCDDGDIYQVGNNMVLVPHDFDPNA